MGLTNLERTVIESPFWTPLRKGEIAQLASGIALSGCRILNIGAGKTNVTPTLLNANPALLLNTDHEPSPNLDLVADATRLPFQDGEFDVIIFLRVLHHIEDFRTALGEALRCTKEKGIILISEPYHWAVELMKLTHLDSHPDSIITPHDIEAFAKAHRLTIRKKWRRLFLWYYGFQIQK